MIRASVLRESVRNEQMSMEEMRASVYKYSLDGRFNDLKKDIGTCLQ